MMFQRSKGDEENGVEGDEDRADDPGRFTLTTNGDPKSGQLVENFRKFPITLEIAPLDVLGTAARSL